MNSAINSYDASNIPPPNTATGVVLWVIVASLILCSLWIYRFIDMAIEDFSEPICEQVVEIQRGHDTWLACAQYSEIAHCGDMRAGDRVSVQQDHCMIQRNQMRSLWRLLIGLKMDVNRVIVTDLTHIEGMAEKTARAIVKDRSEHGPYPTIAAMQRVKGIGPKSVKHFQKYLTVLAESESLPKVMKKESYYE